jgi:predicted nuclease of predicted toxin-antitoxin system
MRVLIDNCLPVDLRHHLHGHDIETAAYRGWGALENGELVGAAVEAGFEALITVDQGTDMARASRGQAIAIIQISGARSNRLEDVLPYVPGVLDVLPRARPGAVTRVKVSEDHH